MAVSGETKREGQKVEAMRRGEGKVKGEKTKIQKKRR